LGPASEPRLVEAMREAGASPLSVGRTIVATVEPYERVALEAIRTLGLEAQVTFNKGAVMVLPSGVNKASGLGVALSELELSPHNVVGVGDAENDHALFETCELSVAVANAIPALRERADLVMTGARGDGVVELVDRMLECPEDQGLAPLRHRLSIGEVEGRGVAIDPFGSHLRIGDADGGGRSTLTSALLEELINRRYQFCLVDASGVYDELGHAMRVGSAATAPLIDEVMGALQRPDQNVIVCLAGVATGDRLSYVASLLPRVQRLGAAAGHPHWLVVDAARAILPTGWWSTRRSDPRSWPSVALVTGVPGGPLFVCE
jgi:hypothetical protein